MPQPGISAPATPLGTTKPSDHVDGLTRLIGSDLVTFTLNLDKKSFQISKHMPDGYLLKYSTENEINILCEKINSEYQRINGKDVFAEAKSKPLIALKKIEFLFKNELTSAALLNVINSELADQKEKEDRIKQEEINRKTSAEADRKAQVEAARKAKEDADRKAKEAADRKVKEEAVPATRPLSGPVTSASVPAALERVAEITRATNREPTPSDNKTITLKSKDGVLKNNALVIVSADKKTLQIGDLKYSEAESDVLLKKIEAEYKKLRSGFFSFFRSNIFNSSEMQ
ncbi:MAG: hypothetical protein ACD_5C00287G0001, partial [uncultured bacterium]